MYRLCTSSCENNSQTSHRLIIFSEVDKLPARHVLDPTAHSVSSTTLILLFRGHSVFDIHSTTNISKLVLLNITFIFIFHVNDRKKASTQHISVNTKCNNSLYNDNNWWRGSVVRTSVFGWRTFSDPCLIYG